MKLIIFWSFCIAFALGNDSTGLHKFAACNRPGKEDLSCQAGLICVLTKNLIIQGQATPVKQCMPKDMVITVETVNMDESTHTAVARMRRFIPLAPCASEIACLPNFCCPRLIQRCLPKLPEMGTCTLQILHNCGCQEGLECRQTTTITVPIVGIKLPLLQCVRPGAL